MIYQDHDDENDNDVSVKVWKLCVSFISLRLPFKVPSTKRLQAPKLKHTELQTNLGIFGDTDISIKKIQRSAEYSAIVQTQMSDVHL